MKLKQILSTTLLILVSTQLFTQKSNTQDTVEVDDIHPMPIQNPRSFEDIKGKMLFSSEEDGDFDIYVWDFDLDTTINLTNNDWENDQYACWFPDGSKIAFTRYEYDGDNRTGESIWMMDADGSNQEYICEGDIPSINKDGNLLTYNVIGDIWQRNLVTGDETRL